MRKSLDLKPKNKSKLKVRSGVLYLLVLCLSVGIVIGGFFLYKQYSHNSNLAPDKAEVSPEVKDLVSRVGRLILLPEDEVPTIATVSNPSLLKGQDFFQDANIGDKVLIYKNSKKAILYSPEKNKIITIAPLVIDEKAAKKSLYEESKSNADGVLQY